MTKQQAYELIKTTFTQSFDKDRFAHFVNELLNGYDQSKATSYTGQMVKHAFKEHVNHCHRLGTYTTPEKETIDILTVHLTKDSKLEKARTAIRNYVAYHLDQHGKDAALVAFVSPSEKTGRFSYVKLEYKSVIKDSGKIDTDTSLTPARRFSYIVGEGESCHTAQTRFVALLESTHQKPSMEDIQESFSVETVTKEFFEQYVVIFKVFCSALENAIKSDSNLHDEFSCKNINQIEYVKKLMGQIVFLYFLQRKGWLGVPNGSNWGDGPKDFLRKLANKEYVDYVNFHNDVLQPLFYDTLATDRGHEAWSAILNCRIPFLNGGLFEPMGEFNWKDNPISLPNNLFTNKSYVEEHVYGTGILDVFDRYNFTVSEAEPLEKEVAIDPEMLGKIFENLIEENRRKGLGAFYTPREIVHYMCQASLSNYLFSKVKKNDMNITCEEIDLFVHIGDQASYYEKARISGLSSYGQELPRSIIDNARLIDETLSSIKVCDPAVGSGAFAVGMMSEIVRCRSALTPFFNDVNDRTAYLFKRQVIQNSIYGVDIDAGAVEIAKLRLWLSLVVDEEDVQQIKPLPNLDYKIVNGNSLLRIEREVFNNDLFSKLEVLKPAFFNETNHQEKINLKGQIDLIINELTNGKESFDFEIFFSEVFHDEGGFDIVIANPPYISYGLRGGQKMTTSDKAYLQANYSNSAEYKISMYAIFMELGIRISNANHGVSCFIVPDSFLLGMYFSKIRSYILHETDIRQLVLLPFRVFKAWLDSL
jgi:type I restriction-modification system DNA methylase subunit